MRVRIMYNYLMVAILCISTIACASSGTPPSSGSSGTGIAGANGISGAGTGAVVFGVGGTGRTYVGGGNPIAQGGSSAKPGNQITSGGNAGGAVVGGFINTGSSGTGGTTQPITGNCGKNLLPLPDNPSERGTWDVGTRTAKVGRLTVEVFYPAKKGSTAGAKKATYNSPDWLPPADKAKILPEEATEIRAIGDFAYREVPIDDKYGPFPVVIFIHGTCSHRVASITLHSHWASHGFVVLSADYPGLGLADQMCAACGCELTGAQDIPGDVDTQLGALNGPSGDLGFLAGRVDMTLLGISGHSQGGCITATLASLPNVKIVLPLDSSMPVGASESLESIAFIGGSDDVVISYAGISIGSIVCPNLIGTQLTGYTGSVGQPNVIKRIVGISGAGHLVPTDLCVKNKAGENMIDVLNKHAICGVNPPGAAIIGLAALFDCGTISVAEGMKAVNYASTAALEETLHCKDRTAAFANMTKNVPIINDFQHEP